LARAFQSTTTGLFWTYPDFLMNPIGTIPAPVNTAVVGWQGRLYASGSFNTLYIVDLFTGLASPKLMFNPDGSGFIPHQLIRGAGA
jgi:hypothetical protein